MFFRRCICPGRCICFWRLFFSFAFRRLSSRHDCSRLPAQQTGVSRAQPDNPLLAQDYECLEPVLSGACQLRYRHRRQENDFQISHRQFYHPVCHYVFLGMGLCSTVDLLPDYLFPAQKYVYDIQTKYQNLLRATSSIARGDFDTAFQKTSAFSKAIKRAFTNSD